MMSERLVKQLHAYHDGELGGFSRWWLERRIARSPEAQRELARLRGLGEALRVQAEQVPAPDLWSAIVLQLPASPPADLRAREREGFGFTLPNWAGAAVAGVAVALVAYLAPAPQAPLAPARSESAVQLLDTGRRPAVVLQDDSEATIILLLPKQKLAAEEATNVVG